MNWGAVGTIAEVIGAIGVIVTLVYLAHQIRDNTRQSRLGAIRAINASTDSAFEPIYIPENTRIWTTGLATPNALDEGEQHVFSLLMTRLIASFDATTYQYEQGALPTQLYDGYAAFFSSFVATPGGSVGEVQWPHPRPESMGSHISGSNRLPLCLLRNWIVDPRTKRSRANWLRMWRTDLEPFSHV